MSTSPSSLAVWKLCSLTCLAMVLLSLMPQIHLWLVRGQDWNGAYVSPHVDEPLYSAYINSLIEGRSRKNDPFGAKDNFPSKPLPESIFSIQFLPAYAIALPARILGISASTAFIVLTGVGALLGSLSVFWLLNCVAGDHRVAAAGTLLVLCLGCVVGRYGVFETFLDVGIAAFPFLRNYQPSAAFPLFFFFQILVWYSLTGQIKRRTRVSSIAAGLTLSMLVFSYLYLWTAAAAWLVCFGLIWFCLRPFDRRKTVKLFATVVGITVLALVPYVYLLSHRETTLDPPLILESIRSPDLFRLYEVLAGAILVALALGIRRRRIKAASPQVIYTASLAFLPFVVFNQQILTGKTMQAFHFEIFVVNYTTLIALIALITLFWQPVPRRLLTWITALSLSWGIIVVGLPARLVFVPVAVANDRRIPVLMRLKELSKQDGTLADLETKGEASTLVFSPSVALIMQLPTWTSQGTLLDMTGVYCRGVTRAEQKGFFYSHLYYSGTDTEALRQALHGIADRSHEELSTARTVVFGYERTSPALTSRFEPIQEAEIEREVRAYQTYFTSFSRAEAVYRPLTYAVVPAEGAFKFTNLDRWYERDSGETVGAYMLYRLKLRD